MDSIRIEQETQAILEPLRKELGALLPILHGLQNHFGYVPADSVPVVAKALNLSRAEVHGVVSFYHWFNTEPGGQKTVYVCRAESCQAMGSAEVEAAAKELLGVDFHESSSDGRYRLEPVYCLGNCACSPSVMIDNTLHSRVDKEMLRTLLEVDQ